MKNILTLGLYAGRKFFEYIDNIEEQHTPGIKNEFEITDNANNTVLSLVAQSSKLEQISLKPKVQKDYILDTLDSNELALYNRWLQEYFKDQNNHDHIEITEEKKSEIILEIKKQLTTAQKTRKEFEVIKNRVEELKKSLIEEEVTELIKDLGALPKEVKEFASAKSLDSLNQEIKDLEEVTLAYKKIEDELRKQSRLHTAADNEIHSITTNFNREQESLKLKFQKLKNEYHQKLPITELNQYFGDYPDNLNVALETAETFRKNPRTLKEKEELLTTLKSHLQKSEEAILAYKEIEQKLQEQSTLHTEIDNKITNIINEFKYKQESIKTNSSNLKKRYQDKLSPKEFEQYFKDSFDILKVQLETAETFRKNSRTLEQKQNLLAELKSHLQTSKQALQEQENQKNELSTLLEKHEKLDQAISEENEKIAKLQQQEKEYNIAIQFFEKFQKTLVIDQHNKQEIEEFLKIKVSDDEIKPSLKENSPISKTISSIEEKEELLTKLNQQTQTHNSTISLQIAKITEDKKDAEVAFKIFNLVKLSDTLQELNEKVNAVKHEYKNTREIDQKDIEGKLKDEIAANFILFEECAAHNQAYNKAIRNFFRDLMGNKQGELLPIFAPSSGDGLPQNHFNLLKDWLRLEINTLQLDHFLPHVEHLLEENYNKFGLSKEQRQDLAIVIMKGLNKFGREDLKDKYFVKTGLYPQIVKTFAKPDVAASLDGNPMQCLVATLKFASGDKQTNGIDGLEKFEFILSLIKNEDLLKAPYENQQTILHVILEQAFQLKIQEGDKLDINKFTLLASYKRYCELVLKKLTPIEREKLFNTKDKSGKTLLDLFRSKAKVGINQELQYNFIAREFSDLFITYSYKLEVFSSKMGFWTSAALSLMASISFSVVKRYLPENLQHLSSMAEVALAWSNATANQDMIQNNLNKKFITGEEENTTVTLKNTILIGMVKHSGYFFSPITGKDDLGKYLSNIHGIKYEDAIFTKHDLDGYIEKGKVPLEQQIAILTLLKNRYESVENDFKQLSSERKNNSYLRSIFNYFFHYRTEIVLTEAKESLSDSIIMLTGKVKAALKDKNAMFKTIIEAADKLAENNQEMFTAMALQDENTFLALEKIHNLIANEIIVITPHADRMIRKAYAAVIQEKSKPTKQKKSVIEQSNPILQFVEAINSKVQITVSPQREDLELKIKNQLFDILKKFKNDKELVTGRNEQNVVTKFDRKSLLTYIQENSALKLLDLIFDKEQGYEHLNTEFQEKARQLYREYQDAKLEEETINVGIDHYTQQAIQPDAELERTKEKLGNIKSKGNVVVNSAARLVAFVGEKLGFEANASDVKRGGITALSWITAVSLEGGKLLAKYSTENFLNKGPNR